MADLNPQKLRLSIGVEPRFMVKKLKQFYNGSLLFF